MEASMSATKSSSRRRIALKAMYPARAPQALPRRTGSTRDPARRKRSHSMPNTLVKRALCLGATALAVGAVAAPAQAASTFARDTAICPTGKVALGGGEQVVGEGTADFHTALQESTPGT